MLRFCSVWNRFIWSLSASVGVKRLNILNKWWLINYYSHNRLRSYSMLFSWAVSNLNPFMCKLFPQKVEVEQAVRFGVLTSCLTKTNYHTKRTMTAQRHWKWYDKDHTHIHTQIVLQDTLSLSTVAGTLWDHLPRISMTRFVCKGPLWILMRNYNSAETFIIYFISCLYSLLAHLPPARKLRINIQLQYTLIPKVTSVFPLFINYGDSIGSRKCIAYFEYSVHWLFLFTNLLHILWNRFVRLWF